MKTKKSVFLLAEANVVIKKYYGGQNEEVWLKSRQIEKGTILLVPICRVWALPKELVILKETARAQGCPCCSCETKEYAGWEEFPHALHINNLFSGGWRGTLPEEKFLSEEKLKGETLEEFLDDRNVIF
jgi:hypothetical protein